MTSPRPIARDQLDDSGPIVAMRQSYDRAASAPRHAPVTHSYATLAFFLDGAARMDLGGRSWSMRKGDVLLMPAGTPHRMLELEAPELWGLAICVPCFAARDDASLLGTFEAVRDGRAPVIAIPEDRHPFFGELFTELQRTQEEPRASGSLAAVQQSLLTLILAEVDRAATRGGVARLAGGGVVVDALRYIERNCLRKLTVGDVAAAVGRTAAYVTTALTRATGRSAGEWIVVGKMAEARRLLLRSDEMVDVIAERVGYADPTHFIRMFRREHGTTPAAWRNARMPRADFAPSSPPT